MDKNKVRRIRRRLPLRLGQASGRDLLVVGLPVGLVIVAAVWAAVAAVRPAPPNTIRLLGGTPGSTYRIDAERYQKIIQGFGVKVHILESHGALENLQRLAAVVPGPNPDVGFVQGGLTDGIDVSGLVSLGSVFAQPLMVYHRLGEPVDRLSQLKGKRIAVGPQGSGTRALAIKLLRANDSEGPPTVLLDLGGEEAAHALVTGAADAAFLMGDSASPKIMRDLRETPGIDLMNWRQAAGYTRRFRFLSRLTLPEGAMDFGKNLPPKSYDLVGPTVELVARKDLHPALSDLLIAAAREVHGSPGLFRDAGEFPAPLERDFRISEDAQRYYKSGAQLLYRRLPFWLASLLDRMLVVLLPVLVLLLPATRMVPSLYRWRVRSRIYRWYGVLMAIERDMRANPTPEQRAALLKRVEQIQASVGAMTTPVSFADQLYVLREHVGLVRERMDLDQRPAP